MAETINIIVNTKEMPVPPKSNDERSLNSAASEIIDYLHQKLKDEIGTIFRPDGQNKSGWILGSEDPEALIQAAENWPDMALNLIKRGQEQLQKIAEDRGIPKNPDIYETLKALQEKLADMDNNEAYDYDQSLYLFRQGMCAISDRFLYGGPGIVIIEDCTNSLDYTELYTQIPQAALEQIKEHPEEWALIRLSYR